MKNGEILVQHFLLYHSNIYNMSNSPINTGTFFHAFSTHVPSIQSRFQTATWGGCSSGGWVSHLLIRRLVVQSLTLLQSTCQIFLGKMPFLSCSSVHPLDICVNVRQKALALKKCLTEWSNLLTTQEVQKRTSSFIMYHSSLLPQTTLFYASSQKAPLEALIYKEMSYM